MNRPKTAAATMLAAMLAAATAVRAADADALFAEGARLYRAGQWRHARRAFDEVAVANPPRTTADASALYAAECLAQLGEYATAARRLERLIADRDAAEPYRTQAFFRAGEAAWMLGDKDLARRRLEQFLLATDEGPLSQFARDYLAEIDAAEANDLRARSTQRWESLLVDADRALAAGRHDAAVAALELAAEAAPTPKQRGNALRRQAGLHEALDQLAEAKSCYEQTLDESHGQSDAPATRLQLAQLSERQGDLPAAVRHLARLLADAPESAEACDAAYLLAKHRLADGDAIQARALVVEASSRLEGRATTERQRRLAVALRQLRGEIELAVMDWPAARTAFTSAFVGADDVEQATARFRLAEIDYALGEFEAAHDRYLAVAVAIDANPQIADQPWAGVVPLRIAQIYAARQSWIDVLDMVAELRAAPLRWPVSGEVDYLEGLANAGRGEFDAARVAYQRVLDDPRAAETELAARTEFQLAEGYFRQRNMSEARRIFEHILANSRNAHWRARAALAAGKCCELEGQFGAARALYSDAAGRFAATPSGDQLRARTAWIDKVALADSGGRPESNSEVARAPRN